MIGCKHDTQKSTKVQAKKVKKHGTPEENKEGPISS
jgi:hypothetical protein